jgi:vesicular inhibitory amino acid transporter
MTSVTYLVCAYTLPAWFALKLCGAWLGPWERYFLMALIPASLLGSAVGLWASVMALINDLGGGAEGGR